MKKTKHWLKRIFGDPFDICDRLKSVDDGYFVVFNTKRNRYEVHNFKNVDTFCFVVPYDKLDSRTVDYCLKTRVQNIEALMAEIDAENARIQAETAKRESDEMLEKIEKTVLGVKK